MLQASAIAEAFHHLHLSSPTRIAELWNWMMGTPNRETMVFQGKTNVFREFSLKSIDSYDRRRNKYRLN